MQSGKSAKIQRYQKELRNVLKKYRSLKDIVLFGSSVKGKNMPNDIDAGLILSDDSEIDLIKKDIRKIDEKIDIQVIDSIYDKLWVVLMREGFSVNKDKYLFEIYDLTPCILYKYNLKKLNPVQKVQFERGMKNLLKTTPAKILARTVLLVPINYKEEVDHLLGVWNLKYESHSYELFPLLRKENFL